MSKPVLSIRLGWFPDPGGPQTRRRGGVSRLGGGFPDPGGPQTPRGVPRTGGVGSPDPRGGPQTPWMVLRPLRVSPNPKEAKTRLRYGPKLVFSLVYINVL